MALCRLRSDWWGVAHLHRSSELLGNGDFGSKDPEAFFLIGGCALLRLRSYRYDTGMTQGPYASGIYLYKVSKAAIHDPGSAGPPPLPPRWFPPTLLPVVWCGALVGCFRCLWGGVVRGWVCSGSFSLWHGVGSGFLAVVPRLLWVVGLLIPMMITMMMGTMITIIIIFSSTS